jgi:DDE superfamily endonuclease
MPCEFVSLMVAFAPLFSKPVFRHAQLLLMGAILSPGKRTVTSALRVMGKSQERHFQNYHRVLSRAAWSGLAASQLLLSLLVSAFAPNGTIVLGIDDTIERRRGELTERARQMLLLAARWLPGRDLVVTADSSFAALELLDSVRSSVTVVTRLRLDAALYEPVAPRPKGQAGRPRKAGKRLPTLQAVAADPQTRWQEVKVNGWYGEGERVVEAVSQTCVWYHRGLPPVPIRFVLVRDPGEKFSIQALLSTKLDVEPVQILEWFVRRWQMEVTFEEARAHLGVETQRQWSEKAIARTTPCLLGLHSLISLSAARLLKRRKLPARTAAWYAKRSATFSDTIAFVRRFLWSHQHFQMSATEAEMTKVPRSLLERLTETLCHAA